MNEEYEYENLVKGYEKTIEAQADMIQKLTKIIKWGLVSFSIIIGIILLVQICICYIYFYAPYVDYNYISGDNNKNISGNYMTNSNVSTTDDSDNLDN